MNRREFLGKSALGAGLMVVPSYVVGQGKEAPPSRRPNIAFIGIGGQGKSAITGTPNANFVAFCDVDMNFVAKERQTRGADYNDRLTEAEKKGARWFSDYRVMFEEMGDQIEGVVITTPDHMHFPIAMTALNLGKHVYCEKPLTHTVAEARMLQAAAAKAGVTTQMGNQGHSNNGARLVREWLQAGVIGAVREVHSWTDRPFWPQGVSLPDHSEGKPPIPYGMNWDLWLGVAPYREYDPAYAPFNWRGWFDFGGGSFGDMACHIMDAAYWGLDLTYPEAIETVATPVNDQTFPKSAVVTYHMPARGKQPPLVYKWYEGGIRPPRPAGLPASEMPMDNNGSLIVGEKGIIFADTYSESVRILPRNFFLEVRRSLPPQTLPRVEAGHRGDWIAGIVEGRASSSDFSYAAPFTEMILLGNVAIRANTRLEYDSKAQAFTNYPEGNKLLTKEYPDGWILS